MSDQQDSEEIARLTKANAQLSRSLQRCRELVNDFRSKLAANSNEPMAFDNDDDEEGESDLG